MGNLTPRMGRARLFAAFVGLAVPLSACVGGDVDVFAVSCGQSLPSGAETFDEGHRQFIDRLPRQGNSNSESQHVLVGVDAPREDVVRLLTGTMGLEVVSEADGVVVATCEADEWELFVDVLSVSDLSSSVRARLEEAGTLDESWVYLRFR